MLLEGGFKIPRSSQRAYQSGLAHAAGADDGDEFSHIRILLWELFGRENHL